MLGGADASSGVGGIAQFAVAGVWAADDTFSITLTTPSDGRNITLGAGYLTNANPTFVLTYKKKLYFMGGGQILWFSALNQPTVVNDPNAAGNGFMDLSNEYGFSDNNVAAAIYQGKIATFARRSIQIIAVDADPANNQVVQTLENIGTVNRDSVRNMGDVDIVFCSDSGFRSLRVLDSSGKLTPNDLGTPIDTLVQARMLSVGTAQMASIVEPFSNRLWEAIGNLIYVFSYFPQSGIAAWSTYTPSYVTLTSVMPESSPPSGFNQWTVVSGQTYLWTKHANESILVCGSVSLTATGYFVADGTNVLVGLTGLGQGTVQLVTETTFTPEKFEERNGLVYVRGTDGMIYLYGGVGNATYDFSTCAWETPWLDARSAATNKLGAGLDAGLEGGWKLLLGMDPVSTTLKEVYRASVSTFSKGVIPATMKGNHFKVRGVTTGAEYARFSAFAFHFDGGDSR